MALKANVAEVLKKFGANIVESNDQRLINNFGNPDEEYNVLHEKAGLRYVQNTGIVEIVGKDTLDFLHRISTNEVKDLAENHLIRTIFASDKGRIIDYSAVLNLGGKILLLAEAVNEQKLLSWLDKYIIMEDLAPRSVTDQYYHFEVLGPEAGILCDNIFPGLDSLSDSEILETLFNNNKVFVAKFSDERLSLLFTGACDTECIKKLLEVFSNHGSGFIGESAYETYRIEHGVLKAPNEINEDHNPHEAGLIHEISFTKGCYIGQEVIARLDTYDKVKRNITGIQFEENPDAHSELNLVNTDGNSAGYITSATYSPALQKHIAIAFVKKRPNLEGEALLAQDSDMKQYKVKEVALPFV